MLKQIRFVQLMMQIYQIANKKKFHLQMSGLAFQKGSL